MSNTIPTFVVVLIPADAFPTGPVEVFGPYFSEDKAKAARARIHFDATSKTASWQKFANRVPRTFVTTLESE